MRTRKVTKDKISNITYKLFCQKGIDALTVRKIAQYGRFSTFPIYYNFPSIDTIKQSLFDLIAADINKNFPKLLTADQLWEFDFELLQFIKDKPGIIKSVVTNENFRLEFYNCINALMTPKLRRKLNTAISQYNISLVLSLSIYMPNADYNNQQGYQLIKKITQLLLQSNFPNSSVQLIIEDPAHE